MKSKAEMSFLGGKKCFPVFAWQCMLYRNMTAIQITFTAYQMGNPLSSGRERAMEGTRPHRCLNIPLMMGEQKDWG